MVSARRHLCRACSPCPSPTWSPAAVPIVVRTASISTLAVSEGRHRHVGRGALIGLASGAVGGALAMRLACLSRPKDCTKWDSDVDDTGAWVAIAGVACGIGGTAIGALIGLPGHEHWRAIVPSRVSAASLPRLRPIITPIATSPTPLMTGSRRTGVRIGLVSVW